MFISRSETGQWLICAANMCTSQSQRNLSLAQKSAATLDQSHLTVLSTVLVSVFFRASLGAGENHIKMMCDIAKNDNSQLLTLIHILNKDNISVFLSDKNMTPRLNYIILIRVNS